MQDLRRKQTFQTNSREQTASNGNKVQKTGLSHAASQHIELKMHNKPLLTSQMIALLSTDPEISCLPSGDQDKS